MKVRKTYKYRLYHNRRNQHLQQRIDIAGMIWNHMIALQRRYYRMTGGYIGLSRMQRHLLQLRKQARFGYWQQVGSQAVQQVAERQQQAYQRFFAYKAGRSRRRAGRPRFKKVKQYKSFTRKQAGWKLRGGNKIWIQGYTYKFSLSRPLAGAVKTVTVKRDRLGQLWVCFAVVQELPESDEPSTGDIGGFDFGLKAFLTDHQGHTYHAPQYLKAARHEIARLNRQLARRKQGSGNWHKTRRRLAKAHIRVAHKRQDAHWKLAHTLAAQYDALFFEDLNIKGMQQVWGRKVSDLGFSEFLAIQEQVCQQRGKLFGKLDRWQATTKPCCRCGTKQELDLSARTFHCAQCGLLMGRDQNAAINICAEGASSAGLGDVRRQLLAAVAVRPQESPAL